MAPVRYRQIADELRELIISGEYPPGRPLPGQAELRERFDVSPNTVSLAIRILRAEGFVSRAAERGRLVVLDRRVVVVDLTLNIASSGLPPWQYACQQAGLTGDMLMIGVTQEPALPDVAALLQISPGAAVVHRARYGTIGDQPVILDTAIYPEALIRDTPIARAGRVEGGIYAALTEAGLLDIASAGIDEEFGARLASAEEAGRLKLSAGSWVATAQRVTRAGDGRPLEVLRRTANPARVKFSNRGLRLAAG